MSTLREKVETSIQALQQFLDEHPDAQDDAAFLAAVKEKWIEPENVCRAFIFFHQEEAIRGLPDESGEPTSNEDINILIRKIPDEGGQQKGDEEINVLTRKS
jgi:hypothetical protein